MHVPADADLLQRRALHFGEADFEHDLLRRAEREQVDDLARRIGLGELDRAVGVDGVAHHAFEHDEVVRHARAEISSPGISSDSWRLRVDDVGPDDDVDHRDQPVARS